MTECNVRDFGAVGNGFTDDTAALEKAIAAAAECCGTVFFPAGKYRTRPLKIPSHITLRGEAAWGYSGWGYGNNHIETGLPVDQDYNGNTVLLPMPTEAKYMLDMNDACGTRMVGLTLDGLMWGKEFSGVCADGHGKRQNLVFDTVRLSHFTGCGLDLTGTNGFAIRKSLIIRNEGHAVVASNAHDGVIMDNQLAYNYNGAGFYGVGTDMGGFVITANRIEGGCPGSVYLDGAQGVTITGNSFDFPQGPAVTLKNCVSCPVTGNMTRGCGGKHGDETDCHMLIENCSGVSIVGNTSWSWPRLQRRMRRIAWYGYVLKGLKDSVVRGNSLFDASEKQALIDGGGHVNTLIEDNQGQAYVWPEE